LNRFQTLCTENTKETLTIMISHLQTCLAQIYITFQQFIEKIHSYSYLTNFWTDRMFDPLLQTYGRVRTRHLWCSSNSINSTHYLYIGIQVLYILVYVLRWQTTRSCCQNWRHFLCRKLYFEAFGLRISFIK
jgi:hypothetical protein